MIGNFGGISCQCRFRADTYTAYGTYFFAMAGVGQPFQNSCILVAVGVVAILINSAIITKYGRRRVFLVTGLALCGFMQLIVAVVYTVQPASKSASQVIVAMSVLYIVAYNVSRKKAEVASVKLTFFRA